MFKVAHYAKSSLSVIKINVLYDLCVQLEKVAKNEKNAISATNLATQIDTLYKKAEFLLEKELIHVSNKKQVA